LLWVEFKIIAIILQKLGQARRKWVNDKCWEKQRYTSCWTRTWWSICWTTVFCFLSCSRLFYFLSEVLNILEIIF